MHGTRSADLVPASAVRDETNQVEDISQRDLSPYVGEANSRHNGTPPTLMRERRLVRGQCLSQGVGFWNREEEPVLVACMGKA